MNVKPIVSFNGTKEQEQELRQAIAQHRDERGALMPILQAAQRIYGYVPYEVQKMVAGELNISISEVYGVVTFYSQFSLYPKGEYQINVCLGTACYVKGAGLILEKFEKALGIKAGQCTPDGKFSIDATRCVGACGLAPVISINEDVYGKMTEDKVKEVLYKYQK
ncbi:NADH-quinone oxidoreductase subunit NuoE [Bacilliculturomica massiliensis]|uniref:NADH-quinone oxidoreductase subunit NuoE n=1 Tax=Bacilliculturomica massiliensis TaxID=1917867 RepID=UPI0010313FBB|nr:NADH-quinone oxidoreductase subunit NuoE [Bacilliculturomica massiliensis]